MGDDMKVRKALGEYEIFRLGKGTTLYHRQTGDEWQVISKHGDQRKIVRLSDNMTGTINRVNCHHMQVMSDDNFTVNIAGYGGKVISVIADYITDDSLFFGRLETVGDRSGVSVSSASLGIHLGYVDDVQAMETAVSKLVELNIDWGSLQFADLNALTQEQKSQVVSVMLAYRRRLDSVE